MVHQDQGRVKIKHRRFILLPEEPSEDGLNEEEEACEDVELRDLTDLQVVTYFEVIFY